MVNNENGTPADAPRLRGWLPMSLGLLAIVLGAVWTLQGLNVFEHELMSDKPVWAAVGGAVAGLGLALVIIGMRRRGSGRTTG
jgi:O-antigen/teichoic acid export membrane protein